MDKKYEQTIKEVAVLYHRMLRKNNFFPSYNQDLQFYDSIAKVCKEHYPWELLIRGIERSYYALPYPLRKIIKYDYFYNNYSFWWESFYTRKQYSGMKKEAIILFIDYLKKEKVINLNGVLNVTDI